VSRSRTSKEIPSSPDMRIFATTWSCMCGLSKNLHRHPEHMVHHHITLGRPFCPTRTTLVTATTCHHHSRHKHSTMVSPYPDQLREPLVSEACLQIKAVAAGAHLRAQIPLLRRRAGRDQASRVVDLAHMGASQTTTAMA